MKGPVNKNVVINSLLALGFVLVATTAFAKSRAKSAEKPAKKSYDTAKRECLEENPTLKGKSLQKCISKMRKLVED